jgi:hypothetical protein
MTRIRVIEKGMAAMLMCFIAASLFAQGESCFQLALVPQNANQLDIVTHADGSLTFTTTGNDPHIYTTPAKGEVDDSTTYLLSFEYKTEEKLEGMSIFFFPPDNPFVEISHLELEAAVDWTPIHFNLKQLADGWDGRSKQFRIDLGGSSGRTVSIRNVALRAPTPKELKAYKDEEERKNAFFASCGIKLAGIEPKNNTMETLSFRDSESAVSVMSVYKHMDLDALTKMGKNDPSAKAPVPLAPVIVAGEGEDPGNHTLIRIFSRYQVLENQFLAWPPEVRGGVGVESLRIAGGAAAFAAWPLTSSSVHEVRLFNRYGGMVDAIKISERISPPYVVCAGRFVESVEEDVLAVASRQSRSKSAPVLFYRCDGTLLAETEVLAASDGSAEYAVLSVAESSSADTVLLQNLKSKSSFSVSPGGVERSVSFKDVPGRVKLFGSAYGDRSFNAAGDESVISTLHAVDDAGNVRTMNAGKRENLFWIETQLPALTEGRFIKNAATHTVRNTTYLNYAMNWSPLLQKGDIEDKTYEEWTKGIDWSSATENPHIAGESSIWVKENLPIFKDIYQYNEGLPTTWFVPFSQRWHTEYTEALIEKKDPDSGLPLYLVLNRVNQIQGGGYLGERLFEYGSMNLEQESLNRLYHYGQRAFWKRLAPLFRQKPEMTISLKPAHENEIASGARSVGDYNLKNIEGFYQYLLTLYGTLDSINRIFDTPFSATFFDAPRNGVRGLWDNYNPNSSIYQAWIEYNRTVVYRRIGLAYREVLLAGLPPELIKSHQIPDTFAIHNIGIGDGEPRVSPIDWLLTAGTGFGYSRYGVDYAEEENIAKGAYSSGFDGMFIGEYASLTMNREDAYNQLSFLREHGINSILAMYWPTNMIAGVNDVQVEALQKMIEKNDTPLRGYAGGIGEVRAYRGPGIQYDIAQLGTGESNTGLLKSLRADGTFEGTVYLVPFHSHVDITTLVSKDSVSISSTETELCAIPGLRAGSVVEISFVPEVEPRGAIEFNLSHQGCSLPENSIKLTGLKSGQNVRITYKVPLILSNVSLTVSTMRGSVALKDLRVYHEQDMALSTTLEIKKGIRHKSGVSFDLIEE